jgi:hypothetical protein
MKQFFFSLLILAAIGVQAQDRDRFERGADKNKKQEQNQEEPDQEESKSQSLSDLRFIDRLRYGGNASVTFGTNTAVFLSPKVGYLVTKDFIAGAGFIYQYLSLSARDQNGNFIRNFFTSQTIGPMLFTAYNVTDFAYVGGQFEYLNHDAPILNTSGFVVDTEKIWSPVFFVEAGFTQQIGSRGMLRIGLRYNLLHQGIRSPYASAWFPIIGVFF